MNEMLPAHGRDAVTALADTLSMQERVYVQMLELTRSEEEAILGGDVASLTRIGEEKEALIEHLRALETQRSTAVLSIAAALDLDGAEELTLSELARRLPRPSGDELIERGVLLRGRAVALREATDRNAALLNSSRELIDRWIHYLRMLVGGAIYGASGRPGDGDIGGGRALDRSA